MPEGDSLFWFARKLRAALEGEVVRAAETHGPGPVPRVELIVGARCSGVRSQGKNMLISFENGLVLRGHLRMYGTWHVYQPDEPWRKPARDARLVLRTDTAVVVNFNAPVIEMLEERALGLHAPVAGLGQDLLAETFDEAQVLAALRVPERAAVTIGDAVMDQSVMAGAGNIWKHESLFRCGVNPWRLVREMDDADLVSLVRMARQLLREAAGLETPRGAVRRPSMLVYGRPGQPCRRCHSILRTGRQGRDVRYTTWCPKCQPVVAGQQVQPPSRARAGPILPGLRPRHG